jgi:hypothetical protein
MGHIVVRSLKGRYVCAYCGKDHGESMPVTDEHIVPNTIGDRTYSKSGSVCCGRSVILRYRLVYGPTFESAMVAFWAARSHA